MNNDCIDCGRKYMHGYIKIDKMAWFMNQDGICWCELCHNLLIHSKESLFFQPDRSKREDSCPPIMA